jgi:Tfp pilus assembly protein PilF
MLLPVGSGRPFIQVELAQACEAMGDFDCARKAYEDLISHLPNSVKYRLELAGLYEQMGYLDMAAEQYRQVLQLEPRNTEAAERLKAITTQ